MEETIGYEALFSSDEWDSMDLVPGDDLEVLFAEVTPDGDALEATHSCTIYDPPGEHAGNENKFEIECERCGLVGSSDDRSESEAIQRLHEAFVATLIEKWTIESVAHRAFVVADNGHFDIICSHCGDVGSADDHGTAEMLQRFHDNAFELVSREVAS